MKQKTTWIVVADGARARFLVNKGPGTGLAAALPEDLMADKRQSRELGRDKPGRTFDRAGTGRHAEEPRTDPHRHVQEQFARDVAALLEKHRLAGSYDRLVLVAAPKMLGDLRKALSVETARLADGELDKDLTKIPVHELPRYIGDLVSL